MTTTVENLTKGQTLVVGARKVKGGKFQVEFAEIVVNPDARPNLLSMFNASDDRFSQRSSKPRRAWMTVEANDFKAITGIDISGATEDGIELNILNPTANGQRIHLEIREVVGAKEGSYEAANTARTAKQIVGSDGQRRYFVKDGSLIFAKSTVVLGEPKHDIKLADKIVTEAELNASGMYLTSEGVVAQEIILVGNANPVA